MMNLIEIQKLIYDRLSECSYTVVDEFATYDETELPYCQVGSLYIEDDNTKVEKGLEIEQYINLYSRYRGKKEILEMIQEVNELMDYKTTYSTTVIDKEDKLVDITYTIYVERDRSSIVLDTDRNNNQFYHAVLLFVVHIN